MTELEFEYLDAFAAYSAALREWQRFRTIEAESALISASRWYRAMTRRVLALRDA